MQVRVVVDEQVGGAAERELVTGLDMDDLAAELDFQRSLAHHHLVRRVRP